MDDLVRHKRKQQAIWKWRCKLYIPLPLSAKNQFTAQARSNAMSQAELGAVVVFHYLGDSGLLDQAIKDYRQAEKRLEQEFLDKCDAPPDRTFGGVFKSSFPRKEDQ